MLKTAIRFLWTTHLADAVTCWRASVHHHSVHAEPENQPKTGRAVYPAATKKLLIIKTHKINSGWESESAFFAHKQRIWLRWSLLSMNRERFLNIKPKKKKIMIDSAIVRQCAEMHWDQGLLHSVHFWHSATVKCSSEWQPEGRKLSRASSI